MTLSACDRAPLLAPNGTVIFLNASAPSVGPTGSVEIVAVLLEQGTTTTPGTGTGTTTTPASGTTVHNGTVVSFTSNIGRIEPAEAKTQNGQARVTFIGDGRSGAAKIVAFSGGARTEMTLNVGAAAAERVTVAIVTPLGSTGGTTPVTATVEDTSGNPLSGVTVQFSTTRGSLNPTSAVTNASGVATTNLTTTGDAVVTATTGSKSGTATVTLGARAAIGISAPSTITAGAPAAFTFTASTSANIREASVNWGDGSTTPLGNLASGSSPQSHTYPRGGNYTVTVSATMADGSVEPPAASSVSVGDFSVQISASTPTSSVGSTVTFTGATTPNTVQVSRYVWDIINDATGVVVDSRTTDGNVFQYAFSAAGRYRVRLTIVPVIGDTRSNFTIVTVS